MTDKHAYENRIEILQGTLDMLILQFLQWGPMHGYGIAQMIRSKTSDVLQIETGSLYPALHRLERQRWVKSKWGITDSKQRAKFYTITRLGKQQMISDHERWQILVKAVGAIMNPEQEPL
jgi:PadR family transcriptional regulator, regulatory protein PadR